MAYLVLGRARISGWIVSVEGDAGVLLYVVATPEPDRAEDIVRANLQVPEGRDVLAERPATEDIVKGFHLKPGQMKGPM